MSPALEPRGARAERHGDRLRVPIARRLPRALARLAHQLAARAVRGGHPAARVRDPDQSEHARPAPPARSRSRGPRGTRSPRRPWPPRAPRPPRPPARPAPPPPPAAAASPRPPRAPPPGRVSASAPTSSSSFDPNDAATTAPTAAIATSPATRAIALFTPDAIPALLSSASASTVAVSGATVIDSPNPNTSSPGSTSVRYSASASTRHQQQRHPDRRDQRPDPHEEARPVPVGERAEAHRQPEHQQRHRDARAARLERAEARHLLQEQHEEEEQQAEAAVHQERLEVAGGEVAPPEQRERQHRVRAARLPHQEAGEQQPRPPPAAAPPSRIAPAVQRLLDQAERDPGQAERAQQRPRPRPRARSGRARGPAGTTRRISTIVISTIGTLIAKIQRHEAESTSCPPITGPSTVPIPPHAVQAPTALPRSSGGKVDTITASAAGVSSAPGHPLQGPRADEHLDRRRQGADQRGRAEQEHAEREHAPLAEDVAQRAADQQQRRERDQVGVGRPLLAREPAAEVVGDRRQRHVGHRRVDRDDGRPEDRRDQHQPLGARRQRRLPAARGGLHQLGAAPLTESAPRGLGPTYLAVGRISRPSRFCSRMCAAQPATRAQENIGVNSSGGTSA